ncbi:MAG: maleylpyruvate isomerase family mycothiol-dependent enzyme [Ilumatobacter sp.]|nr:maleylpyruvate isomerase family mycothiol-dependent enzyme [Ilumatobacter sp.]
MTPTTIDLAARQPLERRAAVELGRVEYHRFVDTLESLDPDDWDRPTDCTGWAVRDVAGHLAGSMRTQTSLRNVIAEQRAVKRRAKTTGESEVDAMTAIQVESVEHLDHAALIAQMRHDADRAAAGRRRPPNLMTRLLKIPVDLGSIKETWTLDFLIGTILTRDTWLHRVSDVAGAIGRPPHVDADHDGVIVADIAAEWTRRHGEPVDLHLTGPAGGHFAHGIVTADTPRLELDAVEFCRILSERAAPTHHLLATPVPF